MTLGAFIKDIRNNVKKITLDELARLTGLSKGYLSKVENNERSPKSETLAKIAEALDISYIELLQKAGHIEEAEHEGLMKSAALYSKYRQKQDAELKNFYEDNRFYLEELLSDKVALLYGSTLLSKSDKKKLMIFIKDILLKD